MSNQNHFSLIFVAALVYLCCFSISTTTARVRYDGWKLVSLSKTALPHHLKLLSEIHNNMDVWSEDEEVVNVFLNPEQYQNILEEGKISNDTKLISAVLNHNIQTVIDAERSWLDRNSTKQNQDDFFTKYQRYAEILKFLRNLHANFSDMTELFVFGKSHLGADIYAMRIFTGTGREPSKKNIFFSSLQHAREWVSPTVTLYAIQNLLVQYREGNSRVRNILSKVTVHVVPVVNLDGYEYAHTTARMWRKNRRPNTPHTSIGVDLNRNWPYQWEGEGGSSIPSSETYRGPSPGSEVEIQNIIRYVSNGQIQFHGAIDFHSYSQLLLRPWQYSRQSCPDEIPLEALGSKFQSVIRANGGQTYQNIRGSQLYPHSGGFVDYMYAVKKLFSYTIELRPTSSSPYGFALPPQFILPTCIENFPLILEYCDFVINKN